MKPWLIYSLKKVPVMHEVIYLTFIVPKVATIFFKRQCKERSSNDITICRLGPMHNMSCSSVEPQWCIRWRTGWPLVWITHYHIFGTKPALKRMLLIIERNTDMTWLEFCQNWDVTYTWILPYILFKANGICYCRGHFGSCCSTL